MFHPNETWLPATHRELKTTESFDPAQVLHRLRSEIPALKNKCYPLLQGLEAPDHWPEQSHRNLERLKSGEAVAIVTGQQPCLHGGPALVLHKALTTFSICQWMESEGLPAVPLFWSASEDHDLHEILDAHLLHRDLNLKRVRDDRRHLGLSAETLDPRQPTGEEGFSSFVQDLLQVSAADHGEHFMKAMVQLLPGLVIVEPRQFRSNSGAFWQLVEDRQQELISAYDQAELDLRKRGLPLQAPRRHPLPLFGISKEGERKSWAHLSSEPFSRETMEKLGQEPSPGALLRPLFTQSLFPIAVSVLGPSEYLYHQQTLKAFDALDLPCPLLWPRLGGTCLNSHWSQEMESHGLDPKDLIEKGNLHLPPNREIDEVMQGLSLHLRILHGEIPQRGPALDRFQRDIFRSLGRLEQDLLDQDLVQRGLSKRILSRWRDALRPKGQPQERVIAWASLLRDRAHLNEIAQAFENPFDFRHRIYP